VESRRTDRAGAGRRNRLSYQPVSGGPVVIRRKREADLAMMRFGGVPKLIQVDEP